MSFDIAAWRAANKERIRAQYRAKYEAHRAEYIERARKWYKANKERANATRRARMKKNAEMASAAIPPLKTEIRAAADAIRNKLLNAMN